LADFPLGSLGAALFQQRLGKGLHSDAQTKARSLEAKINELALTMNFPGHATSGLRDSSSRLNDT